VKLSGACLSEDCFWTHPWKDDIVAEGAKEFIILESLRQNKQGIQRDIRVCSFLMKKRFKEIVMEGKKTPLYDIHVKLGAKIVDFNEFLMPLSYSSIIEEHRKVRESAGLFDVSHMGEILVEGEKAKYWLNGIITNDMEKYDIGSALYTPMCYENGTTVDDLLVYILSKDRFLLVVNAGNIEKDFEWLRKNSIDGVSITDKSSEYAQLAIQGPKALEILEKTLDIGLSHIKTYDFAILPVDEEQAIVSRTGYSGEDGFEIYIPPEISTSLFEEILRVGGEDILPAGLGARDTLRLEAGFPLYSHELSEEITPREANLKRFIGENDFIGSEANKARKRKLIKFKMGSRRIPRHGDAVFSGQEKIGYVTSGTFSPMLEKPIGMALVSSGFDGENIEIEIRDKKQQAKTIKGKFFRRCEN